MALNFDFSHLFTLNRDLSHHESVVYTNVVCGSNIPIILRMADIKLQACYQMWKTVYHVPTRGRRNHLSHGQHETGPGNALASKCSESQKRSNNVLIRLYQLVTITRARLMLFVLLFIGAASCQAKKVQ